MRNDKGREAENTTLPNTPNLMILPVLFIGRKMAVFFSRGFLKVSSMSPLQLLAVSDCLQAVNTVRELRLQIVPH